MKKLNNKGYLTIEIILAATIAFTIAFFLMELTVNFSNISDNYYVDTIFITDKSLISNNLKKNIEKNIADNGIITGKNCSGNTCTLTFDDGTTKQIVYNPNNKKITYDTYSKEIKNITLDSMDIYGTFEENTYIRILLSFDNAFSNGNYDINILIKNGEPNNLNLVEYITGLYNNADKTIVTNNSIQYNYASSVNLMNDRKGNTTVNIDAGNIRYYGASPNNYIDIGDRTSDNQVILWRIIGVFDGKIRIVRDSIGSYSFDTTSSDVNNGHGINQWGPSGTYQGADLMKLLNPGYEGNFDKNNYNNTIAVNNSLWWNHQRGNCYNGRNNITTTCDFTSTGLSDNVKSQLEKQAIYLGGSDFDSRTEYSNNHYQYERGNSVWNGTVIGNTCNINNSNYCTDTVTRTTQWNGFVSLLYTSDYGYATDFSNCNVGLVYYYQYNGCKNNNWLLTNSDTWLISPLSDLSYNVWHISPHGHVDSVIGGDANESAYVFTVRPTLLLKDYVLIKARGNGSSSNPYVVVYDE